LCAAAASLWLIIARGMTNPRSTGTRLLHVGDVDARQAEALGVRLRDITGVTEAVVVPEDQTAYLKVDTSRLDEATLEALAAPEEED